MPLYQRSVLNKYLKQQDSARVAAAYAAYAKHFHDPAVQANIRDAKEEQYQEGFLRDLFVSVLGYTLNPQAGYELTSEFKNEKGSKKADGAILVNGKALAVIELKGTDTTDLATINTQAFGYKANHTECVYVVTSNYQKLRFFIDNAVEWLEFDLFTLNAEQFQLLWLCLQRDNLLGGIPKKVKAESVQEEEQVTKRLYKDYSAFKTALWQDLCANHPERDKLYLYKKSQKLLDRFLFVLFSEDKGLLPPNTLRGILTDWKKLIELDEHRPLYERCQKYFGYLNTGFKSATQDIFAYNGGLFKPDELLDTVRISDAVLETHLDALTKYDFASEVDVNILGHIFEHSLNEIEAITAQIEGRALDTKKTKRKKDGVFYTPKYITKYIVENTVGRLCTEKKDELAIIDEDYAKGRKGRQKKTIQELDTKLEVYRDWLLSLTICDPACGSGAFLNQALDFLIAEHRYVSELESKLLGQSIVFKDIGDHILERNIYGVDINEESVEIARLSLWLRTATKGRKLNDLSGNIKCGNSLIDDPAVAGAKAFDWKKEFPAVFAKGGFDVVVGNPPYGAELSAETTSFIEKHYETFEYQLNSYVVFYERGVSLLKAKGFLGYITPATFTYQHYFKKLRTFLQRHEQIAVVKYFYEVFVDADIGDSVTWVLRNSKNKQADFSCQLCHEASEISSLAHDVAYSAFVADDGTYKLTGSGIDLDKLNSKCDRLGDVSTIIVGIKPYQTGKGVPKQTPEQVVAKPFTSTHRVDDSYIQCIIGKDFHRYRYMNEPEMYLRYGKWLAEPRETAPFFEPEKIVLRQTSDSLIGHIDNRKRVNLNNVYNVGYVDSRYDLRYILGLLNSKLLNHIYQSIAQEKGRTFAEVKKVNLEKLPIATADRKSQARIAEGVISIVASNEQLQSVQAGLVSLLRSKYTLPTLSRALENWPGLEFKGFLAELKKAKVSLTLAEEAEWLTYFTAEKAKAQALQSQIAKTDKEIDALVYQLYGLTEEEVKVVEGKKLNAMEYVIWCDESVQKGAHYSDFYGGMLVRSIDLREVNDRLRHVLDSLKYPHEAKWQKVNEHTLEVYVRFVQETFALIREGKLKMRIMFRQSAHVAQNLTDLHKDRSFHLLYYQFIKHSFGWVHANPGTEPIPVRIYFDKLPDKAEKNELFKNYVFGLQRLEPFQSARIMIRPDDIAEVDSGRHIEMQAVDVVLGAMAFRLNDLHLAIPEGKKRRGKRTKAKETLYKAIRAEIYKMYPNFNIGESTGSGHPGFETRWSSPYRHWKFIPRDFTIDEDRYK